MLTAVDFILGRIAYCYYAKQDATFWPLLQEQPRARFVFDIFDIFFLESSKSQYSHLILNLTFCQFLEENNLLIFSMSDSEKFFHCFWFNILPPLQ